MINVIKQKTNRKKSSFRLFATSSCIDLLGNAYCFVQERKVIDHIGNNPTKKNIRKSTPSENSTKSAKDKDYSFIINIYKNKKCAKDTNRNTNEISHFNSMHTVNQHLGINAGIVKMVCEGKDNLQIK